MTDTEILAAIAALFIAGPPIVMVAGYLLALILGVPLAIYAEIREALRTRKNPAAGGSGIRVAR